MFLLVVWVIALLGAMLLSGVLTWYVRGIARKKQWSKGPESARHIHDRPIPRLGGVAVYLTFVIMIAFETAIVRFGLHLHRPESTGLLLRILMPGTLMFLVGLADDFWNLRAVVKLAAQIAAGLWLFRLGCHIGLGMVRFHGKDFSTMLSCTATVVWVVMLCNAFNLIDGMDGLAAGASVFPLLTFSAAALFHHNGQMGAASIMLTGALLGFLRFNFNPATIFLGDCGSLFLGFMLSALSLAGTQAKAPTLLSVALPVVACGFPIAETCVSVLRRFLSGRPIFSPDREHIHHRLVHLGFSHRQAVVLLFGASGICSLLSIILLFPRLNVFIMVSIALLLLITVGVRQLGYPEFEEVGRMLLRAWEQKVVIAHNVRLRQIATAMRHISSWEEVTQVLRAGFQGGEFSQFELAIFEQRQYHESKDALVYSRVVALHPELTELNWSITLEFKGNDYFGFLQLRCPYKKESLMLDVNVLLQVLKPALCNVCEQYGSPQRMMKVHDAVKAAVKSASALS